MKVGTMRAFLEVHTWVGLAGGLLLFIAFYAGALTMFHHELEAWEGPASHVAPPTAQDAASGAAVEVQAQQLLDRLLEEHPTAGANLRLWLPSEHAQVPTAYWRDTGAAEYRSSVLGADGELVDMPERSTLSGLVYRLHYTAGLPADIGIYLFGFVCVLYGVALVSGVVIYLPVFLRDLFALRVGSNLKRLWQDAHNVIGVLSLPFHVIFAWSGAVLCIGTLMLAPFQFLVFDGKLLVLVSPEINPSAEVEPASQAAPLLPLATLIARARAEIPALTVERLNLQHAGDAHAQVTVEGDTAQGALNSRSVVVLDGVTGEVRRTIDPRRQSVGQAFLYGLFGLHFGDFGGAAVQWLYFALGLAGAFLFYSGNLLWVEARRRHREPVQRRSCLRMAQLTLGVSLGCSAGIAVLFWTVRVAPGDGEALMPIYLGVFGLSVLLAFALAPSRGAQALLWLNAALHAGIPVLDAADLLRMQPAGADTPTRVAVGLLALLMAASCARMARAVRRRAGHGDVNSVWAAPHRSSAMEKLSSQIGT